MFRPSLAAAVARSSTTPSWPGYGSDGTVGKVYSSTGPRAVAASPAPGAIPYASYGGSAVAATPGIAGVAMAPAQAVSAQAQQATAAAAPSAAPLQSCATMIVPPQGERHPDQDKELERLRRDLRKAEEKINFFRNQVITLQQQVSAASSPIMAAQHATALPEELARLRQELSEEREKRQAAEQKLLQFEVAGFSDATAATAAVQAKTAELEKAMQQLAEVRSELGSARLAAEACRPSLSSAVTIPVQSFPTATMFGTEYPMASGVTNGFPSTIMEGPGAADIFDPWQFPGGPQRAVIVGCDYAGKPGALRAAIADSVYWLRHFQKRCCMEKPDLRYLCDAPEGRPPADLPGGPDPICAPATCDNIRRGLRWLTHRSVPGEQLFFIFCGNGAQLPVRSDSSSTKMCESVLIPGDVFEDGENPVVLRDVEVHQALMTVPSGVQVTIIVDACHAGKMLDRASNETFPYFSRGHVDYDKLRAHPVLPRFLDWPQWKAQPPSSAGGMLKCQAALWSACLPEQFCVELPIDERSRGVFTYIMLRSLVKAGLHASLGKLFEEVTETQADLRSRWRLHQDCQLHLSRACAEQRPFFRLP